MKKILFNVFIYMMLAFAVVNAGYIALPPEYQAMIPEYNTLVAGISSVFSGFITLGGMKVQDFLNRAKTKSDEKFNLLADNYLKLEKKYDALESKYDIIAKGHRLIEGKLDRANRLLETDLRSKLSNPLIDGKVRELIEGTLKRDE